ncbi:MAG: hypothetical protein N5P05_000490 [Chroococcopsis gigantea SAG 12.99]|jgi:hypothetical protein|nr:hypothetical protein [Chlorogloea purpurea SAG 13.99]MDV2998884.1 hypothetical protein [Chroococcopsis gigantea SAG 12.99]
MVKRERRKVYLSFHGNLKGIKNQGEHSHSIYDFALRVAQEAGKQKYIWFQDVATIRQEVYSYLVLYYQPAEHTYHLIIKCKTSDLYLTLYINEVTK